MLRTRRTKLPELFSYETKTTDDLIDSPDGDNMVPLSVSSDRRSGYFNTERKYGLCQTCWRHDRQEPSTTAYCGHSLKGKISKNSKRRYVYDKYLYESYYLVKPGPLLEYI